MYAYFVVDLMKMRLQKRIGFLEQTEQKHLKKQKSCRDQRPKVAKQTKRDGRKISHIEESSNKSSLQQEYVQKRKKSSARVEEGSYLFLSPATGRSFFQKARARQKR